MKQIRLVMKKSMGIEFFIAIFKEQEVKIGKPSIK